MKYKVGDMTLLGVINDVDKSCTTHPYKICSDYGLHLFTELETDKIVIKPNRNIDHLIELIEARKRDEAIEFIDYNHEWNAPWNNLITLLCPYIKPRKYPVLTAEELKAVKWLVEGGYETLAKGGCDYVLGKSNGLAMAYVVEASMPFVKAFYESKWITETPINLKELLEAQEGV